MRADPGLDRPENAIPGVLRKGALVGTATTARAAFALQIFDRHGRESALLERAFTSFPQLWKMTWGAKLCRDDGFGVTVAKSDLELCKLNVEYPVSAFFCGTWAK